MEMRGVINCSLLKTGGTSGRRYLSSRPRVVKKAQFTIFFSITVVWWIQVTPKAVTTSDLEPKITFRVDKFQDGFQLGCTLTKWCFWPETTDGGGDEERLVSRNNNNQLDYYIALFGLTLGSQPRVHRVGIWDLRYVYFDIHMSPNFLYPRKIYIFFKTKIALQSLFF